MGSQLQYSYDALIPGYLLWDFSQNIAWTCDGNYVTQVNNFQAWANVYDPLWRYDGLDGQSQSGGVGYTYYHGFSQGHFTLHFGPWEVTSGHPWINQRGYGNGTGAYNYGGA